MSPSAPPSETLLQRLKRETAQLHSEVEAALDLTRPGLLLEDYVAFLGTMLGAYRPLEPALAGVKGLQASVSDIDRRWKVPLLERDLGALGLSPQAQDTLPHAPLPPFLQTEPEEALPESLGCLYVLEGSTLGGAFLHRHLARALGPRIEGACLFLRPYGDETGPMWKAFGQSLTVAAEGLAADDRVVEGARQTFAGLKVWFEESRTLSSPKARTAVAEALR